MSSSSILALRSTVSIVSFGAFGRLIACHFASHALVRAYDPVPGPVGLAGSGAANLGLRDGARCCVVILANPVSSLAQAIEALAPHLRPRMLVVDVGSMKGEPARIMRGRLPAHADILAQSPFVWPPERVWPFLASRSPCVL